MEKLFFAEQNREVDNFAINSLNIPGIVLMENAAKNIFEEIKKLPEFKNFSSVLILAGKGNNGGDGFALARHLILHNKSVDVLSLGDESSLKGDALINFNILKSLNHKHLKIFQPEKLNELNFGSYDLIIDSLLGTGSKGELKTPIKEIVEKANSSNGIKIAIDIPTGLNPDTGFSELLFHSNYTVTLCKNKPGLFINEGYKYAGKVIKVDIGFDDGLVPIDSNVYKLEEDDIKTNLPKKKVDDNKYSYGKLGIIAGSGNMPGAGVFSINSALKTGVGAVYGFVPSSLKNIYQQNADVAIIKSFGDINSSYLSNDIFSDCKSDLEKLDVIAIGPGLGRNNDTINSVQKLLKNYTNKKFIIDADALFAIKDNLDELSLENSVLTPHWGEFSNLADIKLYDIKRNLLEVGSSFVRKHKCTLVLKGAPTLIFTKDSGVFINSTGNPALAKFGSGDVLTGLIAGYALYTNLENASILGVYMHGLIADILKNKFSEETVSATDLIKNYHLAIKKIRGNVV